MERERERKGNARDKWEENLVGGFVCLYTFDLC